MSARSAWLVLLIAATACGRSDRGGPDAARDSTARSQGPEAGAIAGGTAADSAGAADRTDDGAGSAGEPWAPLAVPAAPALDTFQLLLVNRHSVPLAIYADGGAGEVLLATVDPADSARVNMAIAADSVTLRAVGPDGRGGPEEMLRFRAADSTRWEARF
jgi:hypothetical protein